MRKMTVILVCLIFLAAGVAAGDESVRPRDFRAMLKDGRRVEGSKGLLTGSTMEGTLKSGESISIPLEDIRALDMSSGSRTMKMAAIGGGLGLVASLLAVVQVSADPSHELNEDAVAGVMVGSMGVGALIGALFGASQKSWESVPLDTASFPGPGPGVRISLVKLSF